MFNPIASTTIGALEQTLSFAERRHELLAGNIANSSTPDYRARDLDVDDFRTALAESIRDNPRTPAAPPGMLPMSIPGIPPGLLGHPSLSAHAMIASLGPSDSVHHQNTADPSVRRLGPKEGVTRDDRWSGPRTAMEHVVYHDNSDVSMEQQVNLMSKNKHMHNLAITTLRSQFELLKAAISERA